MDGDHWVNDRPLAASRFLIDVQTDVVGSMIFLPVSRYAPRSTSDAAFTAALAWPSGSAGESDTAAAALLGNRFSSPDPCSSRTFVSPSFCSRAPSFSSPSVDDDSGCESDDEEEGAVDAAGAGWARPVTGFASASGASYAYIRERERATTGKIDAM